MSGISYGTPNQRANKMSTQTFMDILVQNTTPAQQDALLQSYTNAVHENGECPVCGTPDVAVDSNGSEITGDDVSQASEWTERHEEDCLIAQFINSASAK